MIKNIIFDLDNTIIKNMKEDILHYKEALRNCGYNEEDFQKIYDTLDDYGNSITENNLFYSETEAIQFLNKKLGTNYELNLIKEINKAIGKYWIKETFLHEDTLKYLSSKYNLYVFTNWFANCQTERLKNVGYLKYFTRVFGADTAGAKPFKASFENVLDFIDALPSECIMIGDSKKNDIQGANNSEIPAILFDYNGKRDKNDILATNYKVIRNLKELEYIL